MSNRVSLPIITAQPIRATPKSVPKSPVSILLLSIGSLAHYAIWNDLSGETLAGDLRGHFGKRVEVSLSRLTSAQDISSIVALIERLQPNLLGLSLPPGSLDLADALFAALPPELLANTQIIFGNQLPTYLPQDLIARYKHVGDIIIVRGEGELSLRGLVAWQWGEESLGNIPNLVFLDQQSNLITTPVRPPNLSDLLYAPALDDSQRVIDYGSNLLVQASRGCQWRRCAYCTRASFRHGDERQEFSIARVLSHIEAAVKLGATEFEFCDDDFIGGRTATIIKRLTDLSQGIADIGQRHNIRITFRVFTNPNIIYRKIDPKGNQKIIGLLEFMKSCGLVKVYLGVESGSASQLRRYSRAHTVFTAEAAIATIRALGLGLDVGMIMFDPFVSVQEMMENITFIVRNRLLANNQWPFRPLAVNMGATLVDKLRGSGLLTGQDINYMRHDYNFADPDIAAIVAIINEVSPAGSPQARLSYALKVIAKRYFDPAKQDEATRQAQQLAEEIAQTFLDLMANLGRLALERQDFSASNQLEPIVNKFIDALEAIVQKTQTAITKRVIVDKDGYLLNCTNVIDWPALRKFAARS